MGVVSAKYNVEPPPPPPAADAARVRPVYEPGNISDANYVRIFDTTMRDGEQSPGATLTPKEKLDIARQLSRLGVDVIEAGFPITSPDDLDAVRQVAMSVGNEVDDDGYVPVICGLSRAHPLDIDAAWEAVRHAKRPRVHTFIATSDIHLKYKLKKTPDEVVELAVRAVKYARSLGCTDIEFSPEDAGRSDRAFLYRILEAVIEAGATTLNIPDTVGICLPDEFGRLIADIKANTKGIEKAVISVHCQNDLGLSTANSLAGVANGARQVECTVNGIGERAGNASLEEVVMAMYVRGMDHFDGVFTGIQHEHLTLASRMVQNYSGMSVQPHKAIVGANAFAHESGIHQDGMLKNKSTYEIIAPEVIGLTRQDEAGIVLGKHSGRHAIRSRLEQLGYEGFQEDEIDDIFKRFKQLADQKKGVEDADLEALVNDRLFDADSVWTLLDLQVVCGTMGLPAAVVKMVGPDGLAKIGNAVGTGPVDAAYKAVDALVRVPAVLVEYQVSSVTEGINALASTRVVIQPDEQIHASSISYEVNPQTRLARVRTFRSTGAASDIVEASVRAYVSALNKMIAWLASEERKRAAAEREAEEEQPVSV